MDRDELKDTFHRVNAYRHVCRAVRGTANSTLFHGCFFVLIAYLIYDALRDPYHPLVLVHAGLALLELSVGLWKKIAPSVECVLVDSLTNFAFGASLIARNALAFAGIIRFAWNPISFLIGCWAIYSAWNQFMGYRKLCAAFPDRPSRAQMQYVAEMIRDIRDADPETDNTALDLDTDPPIQALLADELAFIVDGRSGDAVALDRNDLILRREAATAELPPLGWLSINGNGFAPFPLSDANWRNYLRWKGESAAN